MNINVKLTIKIMYGRAWLAYFATMSLGKGLSFLFIDKKPSIW